MSWPLPPEMPWPEFLRRLRHPAPPPGWLEAAAELKDLRKRPLLLRWIAQHMKATADLRARLLPALPWRALAAIAGDAAAHPQARAHACERLGLLWNRLTMGERSSLAAQAPPPLWPAIWKVRDPRVIAAFLQNPRLTATALEGLLGREFNPAHATALQESRWRESVPVAHQALLSLDRGLQLPESGLVLGLAAAWILVLPPDERVLAASRMTHPALRRMVRKAAGRAEE